MKEYFRPHRQIGIVGEIESDIASVKIHEPKKGEYTHPFDARLFNAAGFKSGDKLKLTYARNVQPGKVSVNLTIERIGPVLTEEQLARRAKKALKRIDLGKVRNAFGSHMPLEAHEFDK